MGPLGTDKGLGAPRGCVPLARRRGIPFVLTMVHITFEVPKCYSPFGDARGCDQYGDAWGYDPFGDAHDCDPFGVPEVRGREPFVTTHARAPFGVTRGRNPFGPKIAHVPFGVVSCDILETREHVRIVTAQECAPFGMVMAHNTCVVACTCVPMAKGCAPFGVAMDGVPLEVEGGGSPFAGAAQLVMAVECFLSHLTKTRVELGLGGLCAPLEMVWRWILLQVLRARSCAAV